MYMSAIHLVFKAALLLACGLAHNSGLRPPTTSKSSNKDRGQVYRGQLFEHIVLLGAIQGRIIVGVAAAASALALLALALRNGHAHPTVDAIYHAACPLPGSGAAAAAMGATSPLFIAATLGTLLAASLRTACYNTLGGLFTFKVSVSKAHSLVTHGPYAYVRHPSYTAVWLLLVCIAYIFFVEPSSYIRQCGIMSTNGRWVAGYWIWGACVSVMSTYRRGAVEDALLAERFGDQWHEYAKRVPYRFIPYLL